MSKIGDYEIVVGANEIELADRVKARLKEGWKPLGAPIITPGLPSCNIAQAMTKKRPRA